ncbi:MAG TPA: hypothetical protein VL333_09180 [Candidatus Saccharimonadales bacterium]|jgi:hypothetical protein|nr:hypothetical protein [Candidatus Saccharimonadales bacterium]
MTAILDGGRDVHVTNTCVSYICMRPDHHRLRTAGHRVTTYREQRALCPAAAAEGHEWFAVPDLSLDVLAGFGWIPRDVAEDEEGQATVGTGVHA